MKNRSELIQGLIFLGLLYLFFVILQPFLASIVIALVFAIVFAPVSEKIKKSSKSSSSFSAFITLILTVFIIIIPIVSLLGLVGSEAVDFVQGFKVEEVQNYFNETESIKVLSYEIDFATVQSQLLSTVKGLSTGISDTAISIVGGVFNSIYQFFVFLLLYFYLLKDKDRLVAKLKKIMPYSAKQSNLLMQKFYGISKTVFFATTLAALTSGIFAAIGFHLVGLGNPIIWGLLVSILSLIPTIGSLFVYLLGISAVFFISGWQTALLLGAFYLIFDLGLIENLIKPKLLDDQLSIHPILVFFAIVGGVNAFGPMGIIYGPIVIVFLGTIYQFSLEKK